MSSVPVSACEIGWKSERERERVGMAEARDGEGERRGVLGR